MLGVADLLFTVMPTLWLIYLIGLHTYLVMSKRRTIELIMENRKKTKIYPINPSSQNKQVRLAMRDTFITKDQQSIPQRKIDQPDMEETPN